MLSVSCNFCSCVWFCSDAERVKDDSDTDLGDEERLYDQVCQLEPELGTHITGSCLVTSEKKGCSFVPVCVVVFYRIIDNWTFILVFLPKN